MKNSTSKDKYMGKAEDQPFKQASTKFKINIYIYIYIKSTIATINSEGINMKI